MSDDPGRTAYEAMFAVETRITPFSDLPEGARAVWRRVEAACAVLPPSPDPSRTDDLAIPPGWSQDRVFDAIRHAYERGWEWAHENPHAEHFSAKAAYDYADRVTSAPAPGPAEGAQSGDAETALQQAIRAIEFSLAIDDHYDAREFLNGWVHGDVSEWPEFARGAHGPDIEPDRCIACEEVIRDGDLVLPDAEGGYIHRACCGPERESFTGDDGEPLKDGAPIPEGRPYRAEIERLDRQSPPTAQAREG